MSKKSLNRQEFDPKLMTALSEYVERKYAARLPAERPSEKDLWRFATEIAEDVGSHSAKAVYQVAYKKASQKNSPAKQGH